MRALLVKELREVLLPALLAWGAMVLMAVLDVRSHRFREQDLGSSLWFYIVLSFALALFGGAQALARESRAQQVFVASWPLRRRAVWGLKAAAGAATAAAAIGLGYVCCVAIVGPQAQQVWSLPLGPADACQVQQCFVALLAGAYALGLLWSGLAGSPPVAAGLAAITALALGDLATIAFRIGARGIWPWPGAIALVLAGAGLLAAGLAWVGLPLLETGRRRLCSLSLLVVCTAMGVLALLIAWW